jgi:hypothetical protein
MGGRMELGRGSALGCDMVEISSDSPRQRQGRDHGRRRVDGELGKRNLHRNGRAKSTTEYSYAKRKCEVNDRGKKRDCGAFRAGKLAGWKREESRNLGGRRGTYTLGLTKETARELDFGHNYVHVESCRSATQSSPVRLS